MSKSLIRVLVFVLVLAVAIGLCAYMTKGFKEWNPYCWFGHDYGEDGKCERCGKAKTEDSDTKEDSTASETNAAASVGLSIIVLE